MGILLTIILGGIAGYLASLILNRNQDMGILLNVIVGVVGAFLANAFLAPLFGAEAKLDELSLVGFLMSLLGAIVLLAVVNLFTRKRVR